MLKVSKEETINKKLFEPSGRHHFFMENIIVFEKWEKNTRKTALNISWIHICEYLRREQQKKYVSILCRVQQVSQPTLPFSFSFESQTVYEYVCVCVYGCWCYCIVAFVAVICENLCAQFTKCSADMVRSKWRLLHGVRF